ncbi:hypothetical protein Harman_40000 [Haloarcula mannanilytica]|uniref:Small CPxCG-related zinc finger protein n=1 Tax=Haloarcula mannanilytica TaxID=2509225 RepID=A0A4C2EP30_9EURY|nr:hypothetical protein [Haloarcula mannanilytica]GCF16065.1 hypothetical protein Harman_40000 [Haloarcula mannanilytica]
MVSAVTCQNCGARVDAQYARVFGNEHTEVHACRNCSTQGAVANGAAVDADRDGTLLVHRPGVDEPVEATFHETDSDKDCTTEGRVTLEELRERSVTMQDSTTEHTEDDAFAALVAE